MGCCVCNGQGGIRTHGTEKPYTAFPVPHLQPLGHLPSGSRIVGPRPAVRQASEETTLAEMPPSPSSLTGFLVLDKPVGPSSMQAVAAVRRRAGRAKTGHGGTLDPRASGVLVLGIGRPATRMLEAIVATDKGYDTEIDLSIRTPTDDLEGDVEDVPVATPPSLDRIEESLRSFRGEFLQRPPDFSAVKIGGRRAYALARTGRAVQPAPRPVVVHALDLVSFEWPRLTLRIACAKGFYVRALARDLGTALGTGGCCRSIRRTAVGPFTIDEAVPLVEVPDLISPTDLIDIDTALGRFPTPPMRPSPKDTSS